MFAKTGFILFNTLIMILAQWWNCLGDYTVERPERDKTYYIKYIRAHLHLITPL